jgi:hypothetical protein
MDPNAVRYGSLKIWIEQFTGLEKDALHVHLALLIYVVAVAVFRNSRRSRFPWLVVLVIELGNEFMDVRRHEPALGPYHWHESFKDLWNTMLWPTALLVLGRYTDWFAKRRRADP